MEQVTSLRKFQNMSNCIVSGSERSIKKSINFVLQNKASKNMSLKSTTLKFAGWVTPKIQSEIQEEFLQKGIPSTPKLDETEFQKSINMPEVSESDEESSFCSILEENIFDGAEEEESCCSILEESIDEIEIEEYSDTMSLLPENNSPFAGDKDMVIPYHLYEESYGCSSFSGEDDEEEGEVVVGGLAQPLDPKELMMFPLEKNQGQYVEGIKTFTSAFISNIDGMFCQSQESLENTAF